MSKKEPGLIDWLGLRRKPNFRKARWLGGLISVTGALIIVVLVYFAVKEFVVAMMGIGFDNRAAQSTAIRNTGLVFAALVSVPFVIWRTSVAQKQANTAVESLFNDKINAASDDLHAMRQIWRRVGETAWENIWEADVVRRNAAIDRLEGLVRERPDEASRVARLLSVYVRELSREFPPRKVPGDLDPEALRDWAGKLQPARSDLQTAVQTLGRLRKVDSVALEDGAVDLSDSNLQGLSLSHLDFTQARLSKAQLQGADLYGAQLQGADLSEAQLQGANLNWAYLEGAYVAHTQLQGAKLHCAKLQGADLNWTNLQLARLDQAALLGARLASAQLQGANLVNAHLVGANLDNTQLQGADLSGARLQGAELDGTRMDETTVLTATAFRGAAAQSVDWSEVRLTQKQIDKLFGNATVILPQGLTRPARFNLKVGYDGEFEAAWRAWQKEIGFDPDDPATWDGPKS